MEKAVTQRDTNQERVEDNTAKISANEAETAKLKQEIAELSKAIAENARSLSEATELRANEKADNEKTIADATSGLEAVKQAITVLGEFYGETEEFVQFVPKDSD